MANRDIYFTARGEGDYNALKFKLGAMRGIISMDVDDGGNVCVSYDDSFVNERQIASCVTPFGYTDKSSRNTIPHNGQPLF